MSVCVDAKTPLSAGERMARGLMRGLARLPLGLFRLLGRGLGVGLFHVAKRRRQVVLTNLALCFPELTDDERLALAKRNMVCFMQALLDRVWLWHAPVEVVRSRLTMVGDFDALQAPTAQVCFAPHFMGLDAGGAALVIATRRNPAFIYSLQRRAYLDRWICEGRSRFGKVNMITRQEGVKPILRHLKNGGLLHLSPDMDLGRRDSVFVPFMGVDAATVTSLSRLSGMTQAPVRMLSTRLTDTGYEVTLSEAWLNYPTGDDTADAARMNAELARVVQAMPEQYYWPHRRFKTRPDGGPKVYR